MTKILVLADIHSNIHAVEAIAFLEGLPQACALEADGHAYGLTHSYENYEIIRSVPQFEAFVSQRFAEEAAVDRIIFGHTHRREAHYITITDGHIEFRGLGYDLGSLYEAAQTVTLTAKERDVALWFFGPR